MTITCEGFISRRWRLWNENINHNHKCNQRWLLHLKTMKALQLQQNYRWRFYNYRWRLHLNTMTHKSGTSETVGYAPNRSASTIIGHHRCTSVYHQPAQREKLSLETTKHEAYSGRACLWNETKHNTGETAFDGDKLSSTDQAKSPVKETEYQAQDMQTFLDRRQSIKHRSGRTAPREDTLKAYAWHTSIDIACIAWYPIHLHHTDSPIYWNPIH